MYVTVFFLLEQHYPSVVYAAGLCPSVCPSQDGLVSKGQRMNWPSVFQYRTYRRFMLHCANGMWNVISKTKVFSSRTLVKTADFRHGPSTVAGFVNLVQLTTVTSLSYWASIFVYNTMNVTQRVARVCLRQLRLVQLVVQQIGWNCMMLRLHWFDYLYNL